MRELVVLGTAAQIPTRTRNHNGYLLRWDGEGFLFDPGEGTQRQMLLAGVSAASVTRICLSHAHGDHCLGLPGVVQRMGLDGADGPVDLHYPAAAAGHVHALLASSAHVPRVKVKHRPITGRGVVERQDGWTLSAQPLNHRIPAVGYRLQERDGVRMLSERLAQWGVGGPDVGRLIRLGHLDVAGRTVTLEEVSEPRRGQVFAFVMDTRWCASAVELAADADVLVCESTFLEEDRHLAEDYGHLTARQAGQLARDAGVRHLVLTHFSQRYGDDVTRYREEARSVFPKVTTAEDFQRIPFPRRRMSPQDGEGRGDVQ